MTVIETVEPIRPEPEPSGVEPEAPKPELPPAPQLAPAGFLRRALAFSIDLLIVGLLYLILILVGAFGMTLASDGTIPIGVASTPPSPFITVWFFLFTGYFTFFHSYGGQTPAKRLIRIKVVSLQGEPLSPLQAFIRTVGYSLSALFFGFGFFLAIFEKKGRALHDLISRSQVVLS